MAVLAATSCLAISGMAQMTNNGGTSTPMAQAPQIITVPVQGTTSSQNNWTGPDWNRTNGTNTQNGTQRSGSQTGNEGGDPNFMRNVIIDPPTEFQRLVSQTIGGPVPIFGSTLFAGSPSTFAPVGDSQVTSSYVIGTGDEVRVSATGQLNQQGTFTVDRAGTITIPEVGTLTVAGLRFSDLQPFLRQQIGRFYRNFELSVTLGQLRSIQIYALGETRHPGAYTVSSLSTMANALIASGGIRPQGSLRRIELRRNGQLVTTLDLYDLMLHGDKSKDAPLQPGDVIFVPAAGPQIAVVGSVVDPAIYELRDESTLGQLLQLAHGVTSTADSSAARIESIFDHKLRSVQNVSLQSSSMLPVQNGDIVSVESISDQFKNAVTLRGNVTYPRRYTWHPGMRISDLVPNREALITRDYFRSQNALGLPNAMNQPVQGHLVVSGSMASGNNGFASQAPQGTTQTTGMSSTGSSDSGMPSDSTNGMASTSPAISAAAAQTAAAANGSNSPGGATVGDAMTQNNGAFAAANDVVLNAPDVDLAYAVIERLNPTTLTTSLVPFNLGAVLSGDATQDLNLEPGDVVTIFSKADIRVPQSQQTRFVRLEGEFPGAGVYSVKPGETLRQLVARAGGITSDAYLFASEFTRQSTRRVEAQRLKEYADSLEQQINTESSRQIAGALDPNSAAQTATAAANGARAAVARMRAIQPTGRIILKMAPDSTGLESIPDLPLEDGDRFIVPRQPNSVNVAGQVYNASAFLFEPKMQVRNYLRDAGGPDRSADTKRLFVIRADGSVISQQYANVAKIAILPGDTIVVPPQLTGRNRLRDLVAISSAFGQIALPISILATLQ
jgi:polysaccharide export outer membrane protein